MAIFANPNPETPLSRARAVCYNLFAFDFRQLAASYPQEAGKCLSRKS